MRDITKLSSYFTALGGYGLEPIIICEVNFGGSVGIKKFAERLITGYTILPNLKSVSSLSLKQSYKSFGQIESISCEILDLNETLRLALEQTVISRATCKIYLAYEGITYGDECLLFTGYIEGNIEWNEGTRIFSFEAISTPKDITVGIQLTEDLITTLNLPNFSTDSKNQVLPMVLGCVENGPALRLTSQPSAVLGSKVIFYHPDMDPDEIVIAQSTYVDLVANSQDSDIFNGYAVAAIDYLEIDGVVIAVTYDNRYNAAGVQDDNGIFYRFNITDFSPSKYDFTNYTFTTGPRVDGDADYDNYNVLWLSEDGINIENNFVVIQDGPDSGTSAMYKCVKQEGRKCYFNQPWTYLHSVGIVGGVTKYERYTFLPYDGMEIIDVMSFRPDGSYTGYLDAAEDDSLVMSFEIGAVARVWKSDEYKKGRFPEFYVASSIASSITSVKANFAAKNMLQEVPYSSTADISYYSILTNWKSQGYSVLQFDTPLSDCGKGFGDEVFVTQRSNTGVAGIDGTSGSLVAWGNSALIIKWLIETYLTNYTVDAATFTAVTTKVTNYPCGIYLHEKEEVLNLIGRIAYQSRCFVSLSGSTFKIRYISEMPTEAVLAINDDLPDEGSMKLGFKDHRDLVTSLTFTYQKSLDTSPRRVILKNNESLAPNNRSEESFDIYHDDVCARTTADFWLHRWSNYYRYVTLSMPLDALTLELFDIVTLDITGIIGRHTNMSSATPPIYGEVIESSFDIKNQRVILRIEIPVSISATPELDAAFWTITENGTLPENKAAADQKRSYQPVLFEKVASHSLNGHAGINLYRRSDPANGYNSGSNNLQTGDLLSWDATKKEWIPTAPAQVAAGGLGENQIIQSPGQYYFRYFGATGE